MRVLGIDTETTGLDTTKDCIIELGAVLFDVDDEFQWKPNIKFCSLIYEPDYQPLTEESMRINGIKSLDGAMSFSEAVDKVLALVLSADMIVAHHKRFDKTIILSQLERYMLGTHIVTQKPWICSAEDLASNKEFKCWKLSHLALDRGVPVDPSTLHRAEDDILLMGKMLSAARANPVAMLEYANTPDVVIQAIIPGPWLGNGGDGGKGKAQAQSNGFSWEKAKGSDRQFPKAWVKKIKETEFEAEATKMEPYKLTNLGRL